MKHSKKLSLYLGLITAAAVFFQLHIKLSGGLLNFNLADPFAFLSLLFLSFEMLTIRHLPEWRVEKFNVALLSFTLLIFASFLHGLLKIGLTQWALIGRVFGWLILLAYLAAGYWLAYHNKNNGLLKLITTLSITASFIVVILTTARLLAQINVFIGIPITPNFEGFSANRNAFAFQLLITISLILGYSKVYVRYLVLRRDKTLPLSLVFSLLLLGLFLTVSRAGLGIGLLLLFATWVSGFSSRKVIFKAVLLAISIWLIIWISLNSTLNTSTLVNSTGTSMNNISVQSQLSTSASNEERIATLKHAIELWKESPFIGVGLGVFIAKSTAWFEQPQVIHNTTLWILTEFGLLGIVVVYWIILLIIKYTFSSSIFDSHKKSVLILMGVFLMFGLAHEIFYQRLFWLVLGALLAKSQLSKGKV